MFRWNRPGHSVVYHRWLIVNEQKWVDKVDCIWRKRVECLSLPLKFRLLFIFVALQPGHSCSSGSFGPNQDNLLHKVPAIHVQEYQLTLFFQKLTFPPASGSSYYMPSDTGDDRVPNAVIAAAHPFLDFITGDFNNHQSNPIITILSPPHCPFSDLPAKREWIVLFVMGSQSVNERKCLNVHSVYVTANIDNQLV